MAKIWFSAAGGAFALSIGFLAADSLRSAGDPKYAFWVCPLAFCAYVTALIALTCLTCGIFNIPFPSLGRPGPSEPVDGLDLRENRQLAMSENVLSDQDLKDIKAKVRASANFTDADRNRLLEPYFDQWMQFSGTVDNVGSWNDSCSIVKFRPHVRGFTTYLNFTDYDVYKRRLSIIMRNKRMTVIGQIGKIGLTEMSFVNCRIVC
jgi:hypothetical protein